MTDDLMDQVKKAVDTAIRERSIVNILIAGRSGVGKSTLINAMFNGNLAETGQGRPVTTSTREYTKEGIPLRILDTRGLEMADYVKTLSELEKVVHERSTDRDVDRHIHAVWVCVAEDSRRVEDAETETCKRLARCAPVVGVVTKARADRGFRLEVQRWLPEAKNVARVLALSEVLDDGHVLPPRGLVELVELTLQLVPDSQKRAFVAAQKASIEHKKQHARLYVVAPAAGLAATVGASPIPFTDAALLIPVQIAMLAGISATFGLAVTTAFLSTLAATAAGATAATFGGRALVANLIKMIPGAGTLTGGAISAATAATLTTALGELYIQTLAIVYARTGGETPTVGAIQDEWSTQIKNKFG